MEFMVIENNPDMCKWYEACGVERIFIDLEILGKVERQGHLNTVISRHTLNDIGRVRKVLNKAKLLVRINPINMNSRDEIDSAIDQGADILMLPMFNSDKEVITFLSLVNSRVKTSLLLETPQAAIRIDEILSVSGIDEIHIGLNDLHLALKLDFMMEMYLGNFLESLSKTVKSADVSLGIGGIAPLDSGAVSGRYVAAEAIRLGAERFILSRAFPKNKEVFQTKFNELRDYCTSINTWTERDFEKNRLLLKQHIVATRNEKIHS